MTANALDDEDRRLVGELVGSAVVSAEVVWERPHVVRVTLADGRSAITKRPRRDRERGDVTDETLESFRRERAVLSLLAGVAGSPAPQLLGVGRDLLVMEDLPPGRSLAELLLTGDEEEARRALVAFAAALGRLHAATAGLEDRFEIADSQPRSAQVADEGVEGLVGLVERFGSTADPSAVAEEGRAVADELRAAGWWRTLVHGDPCPDNTRIEDGPGGRFRIFDFEHSSFGSCALDASYLVAPFPTCWCFGRVPDDLSAAAITTYRSVLGAVRPEALDDAAWDGALATALGAWVVGRGTVIHRLLEADGEWGTTSVRVRARQWIDAFLVTAERTDRYPALRELARSLAVGLADAWPDAALGDYPALPTGAATTVEIPAFWRPGL